MLTDSMLREASAEVDRFLMSIIPEEDGEPHAFSKRFEKKMNKLIRRTNHPVRYRVLRTAAAIALAIITLFGAAMAVSPDARAVAAKWFKSTTSGWVEYSRTPESSSQKQNATVSPVEPVDLEYQLSLIPEGYREMEVIERLDRKARLYVNDATKKLMLFIYIHGPNRNSIFVGVQNHAHHKVRINGVSADVYIADNPNESNVIVWEEPDTGCLFLIKALVTEEKLIQLAESVEKN